jgi:multiple sugar transport system substrate-binding protein
MVKKAFLFAVIMCILFAVIGCAVPTTTAIQPPSPEKPVTLKLYRTIAALTEEEFQQFMADPVKKKFPNITLEYVNDTKENSIENLLAADQFPDLIFTASTFMSRVLKYNIPMDLNEMVKKNDVNLNRFVQTAMDDIKSYGDQGQLYALPWSTNFSVLLYNKEIFDRFALPYPKDGMTWDDIAALSKKINASANSAGLEITAIDPQDIRKFASPLSIPIVDPKTEKAVLYSEGWKRAFEYLKGFIDTGNKNGYKVLDRFLKDKSVAMITFYGDVFGDVEKYIKSGSDINWDFIATPSFKETPGMGFRSLSHDLLISSTSKHKEEAFKVIQYLTGDENQLALTKRGIRFPAINDQKLKDSFGSDNPILKGKNMAAVFHNKPAPNPKFTKYDSIAESNLSKAFTKVAEGKTDINTALREAEEVANKEIDLEKVKN